VRSSDTRHVSEALHTTQYAMTAAHPYHVTWLVLFTLGRCPLASIRKVDALQGRRSGTIAGISWMLSRPSSVGPMLSLANHFHSQARRRTNYEVKSVYRSHNPLFIDPSYSCGVRMCVYNREYERSLDQLVKVRNRASTRSRRLEPPQLIRRPYTDR